MKKNTGCGCGGSNHKHCPPMQTCHTAKTHGNFCKVGIVSDPDAFERENLIADVQLFVNVEADICLPMPANDIKNIRKNVHLTQCRAIPVPPTKYDSTPNDINLFIEGFVHKNIQFTESCQGNVKDFSVNVPFKCFQRVTCVNDIEFDFSQKSNQLQEIREIDKHGMGSDRCTFGSVHFEVFNEPINCKLLRADITEMDFLHDFDRWGRFNQITEKMSLELIVRLTQKQLMVEGPHYPDNHRC